MGPTGVFVAYAHIRVWQSPANGADSSLDPQSWRW